MGVILTIDNKSPQIAQYSLQSDVVSSDPSNTSAGVGGVSVTSPLHSSGIGEEWDLLYDKPLSISNDGEVFEATIQNAVLDNRFNLSVSGESPMRPLQGTASVPPFKGTLEQCVRHIFGLFRSGITISFDSSAKPSTPNIVLPAFHGEIWPYFRDFMAVHRIEVINTGSHSVLVRGWTSVPDRPLDGGLLPQSSSITESIAGDRACEQVEINYFGNEYVTNGTAYPVWGETPNVISVNTNEIAVVELTTKTGLRSVNKPIAVDFLGAEYTGEGTMGAYTIAGADGNRVSAAAWRAAGGDLFTSIKPDDPYTIIVTVQSPTIPLLSTVDGKVSAAPYSIAMADGELYPRLFITGTGVRTSEEVVNFTTGASGDLVEKGVGYTLSNRHVGSLSQAYDVGIRLSQAFSGVRKELSRTTFEVGSGSFFSIQGSRLTSPHANYRTISTSLSPEGVSETSEPFTTFADFNSRWAGKSFADFNSHWSNYKMQDFAIKPLR